MTDKLLKIIFMDETKDLNRFEFLGGQIYGASNIFFKLFEDYSEIVHIANSFEQRGYNCIVENNTIYVMGLSKMLFEELQEHLAKLNESLKDFTLPDFSELLDEKPNNDTHEDTEKDIIDKLAEKYKKEAEDKGKLN